MYHLERLSSSESRGSFPFSFFGLRFLSSEPVPDHVGLAEADGEPAISVEFGVVPRQLSSPQYRDDTVQASADEYLLHFPGIGRLYVRGGELIVAERIPGAPDGDDGLWRLILGAGATIAGFRRGMTPLHASAVAAGENCVAFAGQSSAGKSTLAALLTTLGFPLFSDDLCLARPDGDRYLVGPGPGQSRLCDDAVDAVGWDAENALWLPRAEKSLFRHPDHPPRSLPLKAIYILEFATEPAAAGIFRLEGVAALNALVDNLRLRLPLLLTGSAGGNFECLTSLSQRAPIYRFVRPRDHAQSRRWAEILAAHFLQELP